MLQLLALRHTCLQCPRLECWWRAMDPCWPMPCSCLLVSPLLLPLSFLLPPLSPPPFPLLFHRPPFTLLSPSLLSPQVSSQRPSLLLSHSSSLIPTMQPSHFATTFGLCSLSVHDAKVSQVCVQLPLTSICSCSLATIHSVVNCHWT